MDLPTADSKIAEAAEPLFAGVEIRSCGGCGGAYTAEERACPACGPRTARPRWLDALEPVQMPDGIATPALVVHAEVVA